MIIILLLLLNFIPAAIALGILIHRDPYEWGDDIAFGMFICYISWPFLTIFHIGYLIMNNIGKLGLLVAGFLDSIAKAKEERNDDCTCKVVHLSYGLCDTCEHMSYHTCYADNKIILKIPVCEASDIDLREPITECGKFELKEDTE